MGKYGNDKEFMEGFQEFCKLMGMQFQSLAAQNKTKKWIHFVIILSMCKIWYNSLII